MSLYLNICHGACVIWQPTKWGELLQLQYDNWRFINSVFKLLYLTIAVNRTMYLNHPERVFEDQAIMHSSKTSEFITKSKKHHRHS